ncbi:unnamed protein product [Ceutorhynchus assimilis]|uniref:Uncharacterized protein n=1 Tax=Ceutorhynchus assimilis TaxID=467358 RepID=A0A9N9QQY1_9CUCU|nr:unnamed protein product [Ceutorhynchus assimilis]
MKKVFPILCILACFHHVTSTKDVNTKELKGSFENTNVVKDILNTIRKLPTQVITNLDTLIRRKRNPGASEILNAVNSALDFKLFTIKDKYVELDVVEIGNSLSLHAVNMNYFRGLEKAIRQFDVDAEAPQVKKVTIKQITDIAKNINNKMQQRASDIMLQMCESIINPPVGLIIASLVVLIWTLRGVEFVFTVLGLFTPAFQLMVEKTVEIRNFVEVIYFQFASAQGADGNGICESSDANVAVGVQEIVNIFLVVVHISLERLPALIMNLVTTTIAAIAVLLSGN